MDVISVSALPAVYLGRHPISDYAPVGVASGTWTGIPRKAQSRQLVVVQEIASLGIAYCQNLARAAHVNIAQILGVYYSKDRIFTASEYVDLDLFEILPLYTEIEIASVLLQLLTALHHLMSLSLIFRIDSVRILASGRVKLMLDFTHNSQLQPSHILNRGLAAAYVENLMTCLGTNIGHWTYSALDILATLKSGYLPDVTHPFLAKSKGSPALKAAVSFAIGKRLGQQTQVGLA